MFSPLHVSVLAFGIRECPGHLQKGGAVHEGCGIPLESPATKWAYDSDCASGKFKGFMNHFHCSKKKIDCGGLDIKKMLGEIK